MKRLQFPYGMFFKFRDNIPDREDSGDEKVEFECDPPEDPSQENRFDLEYDHLTDELGGARCRSV